MTSESRWATAATASLPSTVMSGRVETGEWVACVFMDAIVEAGRGRP